MSDERVPVLNAGYVRLLDHMGDDLAVANAARASFQKEHRDLNDSDRRLIDFLAREGHTSPFRHQYLSFEIKAPLFVARQWWRYSVGSAHLEDAQGWSEASRRYVTMEPEFYIPDVWRSAPENKKQGSGDAVGESTQNAMQMYMDLNVESGLFRYREALSLGVAPEQARLFLPAYALYTVWRWTASLQTVAHFLSERLADDAQHEIRDYAKAVLALTGPLFPNAIAALLPRES